MPDVRRRSPGLAIVAIVAAACAGGAAPRTDVTPLLTAHEQPDSCAPSPVPATLPRLAAIGDSVGLAHAFALAAPKVAARGAVFGVWFGPAGRVERAIVLRPMYDTSSRRPADSVLVADLRGDSTGVAWPVRLRMTAGPVPTFEIDRSRFCPPVPLPGPPTSAGVVTERPITSAQELMDAQEAEQAGPFALRLLVDATGSVAEVEWIRRSGNVTRDRMAFTDASRRRFEPATVDGVPVPAWFEIDSERK